MRCLHCNKKLSLLKLAKGDSFCSAEHFDAHQLQMSKDSFERLISVAAEETKVPLIVELREKARQSKDDLLEIDSPPENVSPLENDSSNEDAAFARLTAFAPSPSPSASEETTSDAPPYAPFASSPLTSFLLNPPSQIANAEAGEAVESTGELAVPVHEKEPSVCILNLYLRLSLEGTEPRDWTSERHLIVTPAYFGIEIAKPHLGLSPEFPQVENLAPVEPVASIEAVSPDEGAPSIAPVPEAEPLSEPLPGEPVEVKPVKICPQRVPFLIAPSFQARRGTPIVIHTVANSAPSRPTLVPILEKDALPRLDSCGTIPNSTRFSGIAAPPLGESTAFWIKSVPELSIQPDFVLPIAKDQICEDAWRPSNHQIVLDRPILETGWTPMRPLDFDLPAPDSLAARPGPTRLHKIDPQQLLVGASPMGAGSLFLGVLETRPLGKEPIFINPQASAMEFGWRTRLAPFPVLAPLSAAWRHRTSYFPLPDPIASEAESPMAPVEPLQYAPACIKVNDIQKAEGPVRYIVQELYRPIAWPEADSAAARLLAEPGSVFISSTMLPHVANVPKGSWKTGSGAPYRLWEPCRAASQDPPVMKSLPARARVALPMAQSWVKLAAVPR